MSDPLDNNARGETRRGVQLDLVAGLTAASVVLPKAMAYAAVAGLPVAVGLYTAFLPPLAYSVLGSSTVLSVSSTTTLAILTGAELGLVVPDGDLGRLTTATATLTLMVGAILVLAKYIRLGFLANFISTPVLTGFKAGIGLVIILDQVPKLLGLHIEKHSFFADVVALARELPHAHLPTLAISAVTLGALLASEWFRPHSPAPLVLVAAALVASWAFNLSAMGISTVGHIPRGLPSVTLPDLALIQALLPGALGIALMSFTESIAAGRAFRAASDPPIEAGRELLATGAANIVGGIFGAMPAGGGTSQTAVVRAAGGRSQRASIVTVLAALATMLWLADILSLLPNATLAAIVVVYSLGLIQPAEFRTIRAVRSMEFWWALVAAVGVLLFGTLQGIVVAIVLSLVSLASQAAHPPVYVIARKRGADVMRPLSPEHPDDETFDGLLIVRPEGRLFFVNAQYVADQIAALVSKYQPRVVAIDMSRVPDVEYSALQMLVERDRRAQERGAIVWLVELNPSVLDAVRKVGLDKRLGRDRLLFNTRTAIERYQQHFGQASPTQPDRSAGA